MILAKGDRVIWRNDLWTVDADMGEFVIIVRHNTDKVGGFSVRKVDRWDLEPA